MIETLIVFAIAFVWLLYESDWMCIRLPVGKLPVDKSQTFDLEKWFNETLSPFCDYDINKPIETRPFVQDLTPIRLYKVEGQKVEYLNTTGGFGYGITRNPLASNNHRDNDHQDLIFNPGIVDPICGWDWLLNREHPVCEFKIMIEAWGCRHTVRLNPDAHKGKIIQQVSQAALKPTQSQRNWVRLQNKKWREQNGCKASL